jgi:5-methylcytosine-specific restriction enzyme subunit McrC
MSLCEFVFQSLMPDQRGVGARFQQVLDDEAVMSKVFEEFLRKFFELNRREYRVRSESFKWLVSNTSEDDLGFLPDMLTDITLRHSSHTVIVDAKFYKQPLVRAHHGDRERVRSQHLYQLVTYLQHERKRGGGKGLAGVLIYPDVGRSLRLRYQLLEIPVLVSTIDLGREWYDIEAELNALLDDCASAAVLAGSGLVSDQTFRSGSVPIVSSLKVAPPPGPLSRG